MTQHIQYYLISEREIIRRHARQTKLDINSFDILPVCLHYFRSFVRMVYKALLCTLSLAILIGPPDCVCDCELRKQAVLLHVRCESVIDVYDRFLFKVTRTIEGQPSVSLIFIPPYTGDGSRSLVFGFQSLLLFVTLLSHQSYGSINPSFQIILGYMVWFIITKNLYSSDFDSILLITRNSKVEILIVSGSVILKDNKSQSSECSSFKVKMCSFSSTELVKLFCNGKLNLKLYCQS